MSLQNVKRSIQEKSDAEIEAVRQAAQAEASRILAEAAERIAKTKQEHLEQTRRLLDALERKERAMATFAGKSILLDEKRRIIESVLARARTLLDDQPATERNALLQTLAAKAREAMTVAHVHCHPKDVPALTKEFADARVEATEQIDGGFIADDQTGTVRIDYTYDTLLDLLQERVLAELTARLF